MADSDSGPPPTVAPLDYQGTAEPDPPPPLTPGRKAVAVLLLCFGGLVVLAFVLAVVGYAAAVLTHVFPR